MAGADNITKYKFTADRAREIGRKGGVATGKAKRARKTLREELLYLLDTVKEVEVKGKNGTKTKTKKTMREICSTGLLKRAAEGDPSAYRVVRETIGEEIAPTRIEVGGGLTVAPDFGDLTAEQIAKLLGK